MITKYPSPYEPPYNTIAELAQFAGAIVLGTLQGSPAAPFQVGSVTYYPVNFQKSFGFAIPRTGIVVSSTEVAAAKLSLSGTYIFFWGADPTTRTTCIVGGLRGVMAYDASTDTVTRLDSNPNSQIPRSQTLEQFNQSVQAALKVMAQQPITNLPPLCSPSATGLGS